MTKSSLLSEDERDQLLKELAFGIPISELSKKYNLKPIQIEYQRGNNSSLYNLYIDYFCIKDEILEWEYDDKSRFVLNLLWPRVQRVDESVYKFKGKYHSICSLIPYANKILEREGLPLIKEGELVRVRYTTKKTSSQQFDKSDMYSSIHKLNFIYKTINSETALVDLPKFNIIQLLLFNNKRINWRTQIQYNNESECIPLKIWYRLCTEGKNKLRGNKISELNLLFDLLYRHNLLENTYFDVLMNSNGTYKLNLKEGVTEKTPFEYKNIKDIEHIENFINTYCLGLPSIFYKLILELAYKTTDEELIKYKDSIRSDLESYIDYLSESDIDDDTLNNITFSKIHDFVEENN